MDPLKWYRPKKPWLRAIPPAYAACAKLWANERAPPPQGSAYRNRGDLPYLVRSPKPQVTLGGELSPLGEYGLPVGSLFPVLATCRTARVDQVFGRGTVRT